MPQVLLNARDVARLLRVSLSAAYREMKSMRHVIVGLRSLRVAEAAFEAYLNSRTVEPWGPTRHRVAVRKAPPPPSTGSLLATGDDDLVVRPIRLVYPRTKPRTKP
jgi:hypothetical protein